eukprot:g3746.t1
MLNRNADKSTTAIAALKQEFGNGADVTFIPMDLSVLASVRNAAGELLAKTHRIDALICNAAIAQVARQEITVDGFESQLGVNHFAHFLLCRLLFARIRESEGRIVVVGSNAYKMGRRKIQFDDLNFDKNYTAWNTYAQSKLAQMMFAYELQRRIRIAGENVQVQLLNTTFMSKQTIFVSEISYAKGEEVFTRLSENTGFTFTSVPEDEPTLSSLIREQNVRGFIADVHPYTGELYSALPSGSAISRFGVGHDSIDKEKASAAGIHVANTPGVLNTSVAEHAMWLLGSLARNVASLDRSMRSEKWEPKRGIEVKGKTLAILGFGRIAQDICRKAHHGFGMNVIGFDQFDQEQFCKFAKVDSFEEFRKDVPVERITTDLADAVGNADFVLMMMAVTPETVGMANTELFSKMKKDGYFLNTARGALVNENDLYDALISGTIAGAALDVFIQEPYIPQSAGKDLRTLGNIVITPHVASNTAETNAAMAEASAKNVMTILTEGSDACPNIVNR